MLGAEKEFFVHIINFDIVTIQMKNITEKSYMIPKNFKVDHLKDYDEKDCFLTVSKNRHLVITSVKNSKKWKKLKPSNDQNEAMKTVLFNDITIYGNADTMKKLKTITEKIFQMWCSIFEIVNIPRKKWMKINIVNAETSKLSRIFKLNLENKIFIDKKFDALHEQNKMSWTTKFTSYVFSVFVVWHTVHLSGKESLRKGRVVIDIKNLNKITKFDAYSMLLQSNIISAMQDCKFISIMDCATFFHQWKVVNEDKHKFTMITHRGSEQWNVAVMN